MGIVMCQNKTFKSVFSIQVWAFITPVWAKKSLFGRSSSNLWVLGGAGGSIWF